MKQYKKIIIIMCFTAIVLSAFLSVPRIIAASSAVGNRNLPIYCVDTASPDIALTFDAAWGNEDTAQILEILENNEVKATFFMTGQWVDSFPEDVKAIANAGHDLGNHSQNHKQMSCLSEAEITNEIMSVHKTVKELTGQDMILFRPPYGDYNNRLITTAEKCRYYAVQWNTDSLDWKNYGCESIINTVVNHKNLGNGSIILMHNGAKYTKDALDTVIKELKKKGYHFVRLSELIYRDNYHMDHTGRQISDQKQSTN